MTNDDAKIDRTGTSDSPPTVTHANRSAAAASGLPEQIGKFKILAKIGEGGMGTVYEAEQDSPKRTVALKVIRGGLASAALLKRFALESQVLGRLQHPGIAQIYQAGTAQTDAGERPYFAMEYVRGVDVRRYIVEQNLDIRQRLELLARICDAVHHAHQKGVVHRDLKPGNILVDQTGQPKILDFGVARTTDADMQVTTMQTNVGQIIGTLQYMSPEQVAADPNDLDTRSDVYTLGVIAHELLTGQLPYDLKNKMIHEAARVIREEGLTRISTLNRTLRGDIETIVAKALAKEKERRYQSAAGLAEDIRRHLDNEPILARPPSAMYQLQKFAKRNKALAGGLAVAMLALFVGMGTSTHLYIRADRARRGEALQRKLAEQREAEAVAARSAEQQQRKLAETRADELKTVSRFQQSMLSNIDAEGMGRGIVAAMRDRIRDRLAERNIGPEQLQVSLTSFDELVGNINATNLALDVVDEHVLRRAAETIATQFADQPQVRDSLQQAVATTYREIGLLSAAFPLQEAVLDARRQHLGEDHPDTLHSMSEMGLLLDRMGRAPEAEPYLRRAVEGSRRVLGEEHPDTLNAMSNLSSVLYWMGRIEETLPLHRQVLEARRRVSGDDHSDTLVAMNNMSIVLQDLGLFDEAEVYRRKVLEGQRRLLGDDHPKTLIALFNLGYLYQGKGDLEQALRYYRQTLEAERRVLGDDHPATLQCMNAVGMMLDRLGRVAEAEPYYRGAMEGRRRVLGDVHRDTLLAVNNMGYYLNKAGRFDEAAELLEAYEPAARQTCAKDVPHMLALFLSKLGDARAGQKRFAAAKTTLLESAALHVQYFGESHQRTQGCIKQLIALYEAWHTAEPGGGYIARAAKWRAKLEGEDSKEGG